jgi:periplasmic copper chaperone A
MSQIAICFAFAVAVVSASALAHEVKIGSLVIVHPMVDEAEKGQAVAHGSMEIRNEGDVADQLLTISSEFADEVTIEGPTPVVVPAKGRAPVLMQFKKIKRKLSEYEVYDGVLMFEKAGKVDVDLMVHTH